ncbi:MAG: acetamidase/formamidase family protein, partial [bacterium]|nr:acetamidase/formamidase family protein [bacterium]
MGIGSCGHTIHEHQHHHVWDRDIEPALEVDDSASVAFDTIDASGGQLSAASTHADLANVDFGQVNPVSGPVFVRGARPGDVLEVEVLELAMTGWGWTALIPGFGLLADQFPDPWLKHWALTPGAPTAAFSDGVDVPVAPFPGTIGLAPPTPGPHGTVPPHAWGGNLDIRHLTAGTKLYLPVGVEGALFSVGDTHAAQGDGEVCGTAIESRMQIALRFAVRRDLRLTRPAFETFGAAPGDRATPGSFVTTGVAADLMTASREAIAAMIDHLMATAGLDANEAYA